MDSISFYFLQNTGETRYITPLLHVLYTDLQTWTESQPLLSSIYLQSLPSMNLLPLDLQVVIEDCINNKLSKNYHSIDTYQFNSRTT